MAQRPDLTPPVAIIRKPPAEAWPPSERRPTVLRDWAPTSHVRSIASCAHAFIFGDICLAKGTKAGPVMPRCPTEAMGLHLDEIARTVAPSSGHAMLLLDQAGWHTTKKLTAPSNITPPVRSLEINRVENLSHFICVEWLGTCSCKSYADILDHCCRAWNTLIDRPRRIMSFGIRAWGHEF